MKERENKTIISPCGLYCGVCVIYQAHQKGDLKSKKIALAMYKSRETSDITAISIDDIKCSGCRSSNLFKYCQACKIRECVDNKGYEGCHQCSEFPCEHIESFPIPEAKKIIKATIPIWREIGTKQWVESQEKQYTCKNCGTIMFRGANRCTSCRKKLKK